MVGWVVSGTPATILNLAEHWNTFFCIPIRTDNMATTRPIFRDCVHSPIRIACRNSGTTLRISYHPWTINPSRGRMNKNKCLNFAIIKKYPSKSEIHLLLFLIGLCRQGRLRSLFIQHISIANITPNEPAMTNISSRNDITHKQLHLH